MTSTPSARAVADAGPELESHDHGLRIVPTPVRNALGSAAYPVRAYVSSRLLVLACAFVTTTWINTKPGDSGIWPKIPGPHIAILQALARWDGAWYLDIAAHGYRPTHWGHTDRASIAFFPGFSMLVRADAWVTGMPQLVAAVVTTFVLGAVFTLVAWYLVRDIAGTDAAKRATLLLCFAPGTFVFSMAYAEALFLVACIACLVFMTRQQWVTAGVFGAIATLSRPNGVALLITCAIIAAVVIVRSRNWRALAAPLVASTGIVAYFAYLVYHTGEPAPWFDVQRKGWDDRVAPIETFTYHIRSLIDHGVGMGSGNLNDLIWLLGLGVGVLGVVLLIRWGPPLPILVYGVCATVFALVSYQVGLRPRMVLAAFPIVLAIGVKLRGNAYRVALAASIVALVAVSMLTFSAYTATP